MLTLPVDENFAIRLSRNSVTLRGHSSRIKECKFSPNGSLVVSGSVDHTIKIWNSITGECIKTLIGHKDAVFTCNFSPDGSKIVSGSEDRTIKVWDISTEKCIRTLTIDCGFINSCIFSTDGSRVAVCLSNGEIALWDVVTWEHIIVFPHNWSVRRCDFIQNNSKILSCAGNYISIFDTYTKECITTSKFNSGDNTTAHLIDYEISPNKLNIIINFASINPRLYAISDGPISAWSYKTLNTRTLSRNINFSPGGTHVVYAWTDSSIRIYNLLTEEVNIINVDNIDPLSKCAFSPDGTQIMFYSKNYSITLWEFHFVLHTQESSTIPINHNP